jgi:hypothetical protein
MSASISSQIIARLTPANYEAERAFNDVAVRIVDSKSDTNDFHHAARYMVIKPYIRKEPEFISRQRGADDTGTETEAEEARDPAVSPSGHLEWGGCHEIRFGTPPSIPLLGWFIGIGRWDAESVKPNGGVDLQLALPRTKYNVAGRHARMFFDKDGGLIIRVVSDRSPVIVLGNEEFTHGQRLITESRTRISRISFGKLCYNLEFCPDNQD